MSGLLPYDKPVDGTIWLTEAYHRYRARVLPVQQPAAAVERLMGELRAELAEASFSEKPTHEQTPQERAKAEQETKERRLAIAYRYMESLREGAEADEYAKKEREVIETFMQALEKGEVTPLVPRTGTGFYWHLAGGWERDFTISLFLFPEVIDEEEHPYWKKEHGEREQPGERPFVEEAAFNAWLDGKFGTAEPSDYAPPTEGGIIRQIKVRPDPREAWDPASKWFDDQIAKWKDGGRRLTRREAENALLAKFEMKSSMARRVWAEKAPPEWRKPGPRPGRSTTCGGKSGGRHSVSKK
jgi:hypothetical protein